MTKTLTYGWWWMWCCGALVGFALGWFGCMITNGVPL
jgi:hypothetical protein